MLIEPDDFDFFGFDDGLEDGEILAGEFDSGGDEDLPGIQEEVGDFGETAHDFARAAGGIMSFEVGVDTIKQGAEAEVVGVFAIHKELAFEHGGQGFATDVAGPVMTTRAERWL